MSLLLSSLGSGKNEVAFTLVEVVYFAVLWLLAFAAGTCRTLRDHSYQHVWDVLAVGAVGGFYGFSTCAVFSHYGPSVTEFGWGYLGVAAAIGALGKEQEKFMRFVVMKFLGVSDNGTVEKEQTEKKD